MIKPSIYLWRVKPSSSWIKVPIRRNALTNPWNMIQMRDGSIGKYFRNKSKKRYKKKKKKKQKQKQKVNFIFLINYRKLMFGYMIWQVVVNFLTCNCHTAGRSDKNWLCDLLRIDNVYRIPRDFEIVNGMHG
jgi:hypothetical protein